MPRCISWQKWSWISVDIGAGTCQSCTCHLGSSPAPAKSTHWESCWVVSPWSTQDGGTPHQHPCVPARTPCSPSLLHGLLLLCQVLILELLPLSRPTRNSDQGAPCPHRSHFVPPGQSWMPFWPSGPGGPSCTLTLVTSSSTHSSRHNIPSSTPLSLLGRKKATASTCGRQTRRSVHSIQALRLRHAVPPARHRSEQTARASIPHHLQGFLPPPSSCSRDLCIHLCTLVQGHAPTELSPQELWHFLWQLSSCHRLDLHPDLAHCLFVKVPTLFLPRELFPLLFCWWFPSGHVGKSLERSSSRCLRWCFSWRETPGLALTSGLAMAVALLLSCSGRPRHRRNAARTPRRAFCGAPGPRPSWHNGSRAWRRRGGRSYFAWSHIPWWLWGDLKDICIHQRHMAYQHVQPHVVHIFFAQPPWARPAWVLACHMHASLERPPPKRRT